MQKRDSKECEQYEQLSPISPIFDTKSTNHHKISKLSAKIRNSCLKKVSKNNSLPARSSLSSKHFKLNPIISSPETPRQKQRPQQNLNKGDKTLFRMLNLTDSNDI